MKYKYFYEYKQSYMYPANPSGGHEKRVAAVGCRMSNVLFGTGIFQGGQGPEHRAMSIALRTEAYLMIYETIPAQLSDRHGGRISTSKLGQVCRQSVWLRRTVHTDDGLASQVSPCLCTLEHVNVKFLSCQTR